jgi:hypothetical protein
MKDIDLKREEEFDVRWPFDTNRQNLIDVCQAMELKSNSSVVDCRLAAEPPKKYEQIHSFIPFKKRLLGTLNRMRIEGGHSPEVLNTIISLIIEDK